MKNQPVDWNWQFKEKNKTGDGMEETHSTCFLLFFREQCVQRGIADHAENQQRTA